MVVQIMMMILSLLKVVMVVEGGDGGPGPENGKSCTLVVLLGGVLASTYNYTKWRGEGVHNHKICHQICHHIY